jgi:SH3-like domain-containing protein
MSRLTSGATVVALVSLTRLAAAWHACAMSASYPAPFVRLILCATLLARLMAGTAWGQSPAPTTGTLQSPAKQQTAPPAASSPPKPAPREPVHQVAPKPAPVVQPHGVTHAQKPPAKPPRKPSAKPPAKPPPAGPAIVPPAPLPVPVEPPKRAETDTAKGSASGLPVPRFVALRSDEVNLRAGPGTRYPIDWVYKRRDLPVEILREFEVWRLVQDSDGIKGWVHQATLTGRRSFIVTGGDATLRRDAQDSASAVAVLKPGVIGHIRSCAANSDWCQIQVGDYRGYLKRSQFWGTLPAEAVAN